MAVRQYIGARYVPKFYEGSHYSEWEANVQYEALTIVTYLNNTYTSKRFVPASVGSPIQNPDYWVATGMYNEQLNAVVERVNTLENTVGDEDTGLVKDVNDAQEDIHELELTAEHLQEEIDNISVNATRKYLLISDSYGGYTSEGITYSWIDDVISLTGIDAYKLSAGSIGFRPAHDNISSFYKLLDDAINNELLGDLGLYTDIIVCGGANDITNVHTGAISKDGLITQIGNFNTLCRDNFPNANVYVGMIGNYKSSNYARSYYTVLEAYRECRRFGIGYLENVEYILGMEYIKSDDGVHPTPDGFNELAKYLSEAVINKICNVNRPMRVSANSVAMNPNVGAWNLVPETTISQNNGHQKVSFNKLAIGCTLSGTNRLAFDTVVCDLEAGQFKLFAIGEMVVGHVKGGGYNGTSYEPYFCGNALATLAFTDNHVVGITTPVAIVNGVLYLCLPSSAAFAQLMYGENASFSQPLLYIRVSNINIEIDASNYNGS